MWTSFTLPSHWALETHRREQRETNNGVQRNRHKQESSSALSRAARKLPVMRMIRRHNNYRCTRERSPERGPTHMQMPICPHAYRASIHASLHAHMHMHTHTHTVQSHVLSVQTHTHTHTQKHPDKKRATLDDNVGSTALCRTHGKQMQQVTVWHNSFALQHCSACS